MSAATEAKKANEKGAQIANALEHDLQTLHVWTGDGNRDRFWMPSNVEPLFRLLIFLICAYVIGRSAKKPFLTAILLGLANSVWITTAHILLFRQYLEGHAREAAMMKSMPLPGSPRTMMAMMGPVVGPVSGVIIGLLALLASKLAGSKRLALD